MVLQKMTKVQIVGPKEDLGGVVDLLYRQGTIHLEEARHTGLHGDPVRRMEARKGEDLSQLLVRIGAVLQALPTLPEDRSAQAALVADLRQKKDPEIARKAAEVISQLEARTKDLAGRKGDLESTIANLSRYAKIIERIRPLEEQLPVLEGFEVTVILVAKEFAEVIDVIRDALAGITQNQYEILAADVDEATIAAVTVFNRRYSEQVHSFIYSQNVNEVRLPSEFMGKPFNEIVGLIGVRKAAAALEIGEIDKKLAEIAGSWYQQLRVIRSVLEDRVNEANVYGSFGQTEYTFVIAGWVPSRALNRLTKAVTEGFGNRVVVNVIPIDKEEIAEAPVFYDNPWFVKPFEFLMNLVSAPKYWEIDPVPFLAIGFPIFFGLMVGDVAYGLIILALALAVKFRMKRLAWAQPLANILIIASIPSILFGFLFGEFLGNLGHLLWGMEPVTFLGITWDRMQVLIPMLVLSIAIGVVHLFLGLGLGMINAMREGSRKHLCDKCGMMMVIAGIILVLVSFTGYAPAILSWAGVILILVGLPLLVYGGGVFGPSRSSAWWGTSSPMPGSWPSGWPRWSSPSWQIPWGGP